jgi:hypothetical protein
VKSIVLEPCSLEAQNGDHVRRCGITRFDDDVAVDRKEVWFRFSQQIDPPDDDDCDSYLLAVLMDSMHEQREIIVKGSVAGLLLSNLVEYQTVWHKWFPDDYRPVQMQVDSIREDEITVPGAVCAFSGGVDAVFTAWRHQQQKVSYRSETIKLCSLIHGFDIPLSDEKAFASARQKVDATLDDLGIKQVPIATNCRQITNVIWEYAFGCGIVGALSNFKRVAGTCLIGSCEPYGPTIDPWGSSSLADHLLGSNGFRIIHDGASHSRIEKVDEIAQWKMGVENLRVCWGLDLNGENCGHCEKCVRTKLNFLANGHPIPASLGGFDDLEKDLKRIVLKDEGYRKDWQEILQCARNKGIKEPWVRQVPWVIRRRRLRRAFKVYKKRLINRLFYRKANHQEQTASLTSGKPSLT